MTLLSKVTAPFLAKALPQPMVAPLFRVMLVSARMFPWNDVVVPRVAELPTCQNTFGSVRLLLKMTGRVAGSCQRSSDLENTNRALGFPVVERQLSRKLSRACKKIDARRESHSTQVPASQGKLRVGEQGHGRDVGDGQITLSLSCGSVGGMDGS